MDETPNLRLPYILAAQSQKHVTHNEAIRALDAIVQLSVLDRHLASPPGSPPEGARYIVGPSPSAGWAGQAGKIAAFQDGAWAFYEPREGWLAWIADENALCAWDGSAWAEVSAGGAGGSLDMLGINASADTTNRLVVASEASLFNHAGGGHQHKINKASATDTASLLFQTGFSGRAEFGLAGDDDYHVKVSADGSAWNEAMIADRTSGAVRFPSGLEHAASRALLSGLIFTPGGDGQISIYRNDRTRSQTPRTATISSVSGDTITLTTGAADLFFAFGMAGVSYARIWNTSKNPNQSAWVKAVPDWTTNKTQLRVTDAAHIASWANGETVQLGDPTSPIGAGRSFALDISPMLQNVLGAVFRQRGIICKAAFTADAVAGFIDFSPSAATGSFVVAAQNAATSGTWHDVAMIPCTDLSPISNSNLIHVRETSTGNIGTALLSSIAVFG